MRHRRSTPTVAEPSGRNVEDSVVGMSMHTQQETRFARVVGTRFLAFVCASEESQLEARLTDGRPMRPEQEDVLGQVLASAAQSAVVAFQMGGGEGDFLYPLLEYDETAGLSRPNALRRLAGGAIPRIRFVDPVEKALATLARDLYPALLLDTPIAPGRIGPPRWVQRTWSMSPVLYRHPAAGAFEAAAENDHDLKSLFTHETPESGKTGFIWTSLGTGRSVQLSMLAHDLMVATLFQLTLEGDFEHAGFINGSALQLRTLRRLLAGERISVRCSIAFVGAELRGGPLETPWGTLRKPTTGELDLRADTPVAHSQELVLATKVPLEVRIGREPPSDGVLGPTPFAEEVASTYASLQQKADLLALTLLLGLQRQPVVAIARTWTVVENPLNQGPSLSWSQNAVPLHPHVLESDDRRRIRTWANRIDRHYSDRIEIAVKRTLSSLTTRWDATDRLIDAVVALENLFGTGSGELAFRISAGCAYLLEREPGRRIEIQKEVARLYTVRSKIVHGAHAPAPNDVDPDARAASDFAVGSLRALFARRPELLDAKERAHLLILGNAD
jgi:hypothetical protein